MSLNVEYVVVTDKKHMAELFNHHFIKSGCLFDSASLPVQHFLRAAVYLGYIVSEQQYI
jgi:hypothetical protein